MLQGDVDGCNQCYVCYIGQCRLWHFCWWWHAWKNCLVFHGAWSPTKKTRHSAKNIVPHGKPDGVFRAWGTLSCLWYAIWQHHLILTHQWIHPHLSDAFLRSKKLRLCALHILRIYMSYIQFFRSENAAGMIVSFLGRACWRLPTLTNITVSVPRSCPRAI